VIGDAHVELGEYDQAFDAFDRMNALKPTAGSYARASYARELQGDLPEALRLMQMAAEATPRDDRESLAWHRAELGHLFLEMGRLRDARREFEHAEWVFPGHPLASAGLARVEAAGGHYARALAIVQARLSELPGPADHAFAGDLLSTLGRPDEAERHYRLAESAWQTRVPEPTVLARFLAERGRNLNDALRLAEMVSAERRDIFTADALAWARFRLGRLEGARTAIRDALRTGTRNRVILFHAAAIEHALGHDAAARPLVARSRDAAPRFDLVAAPAAAALAARLGDGPAVMAGPR
jgi:tetratricopeptide (TPR) repeat protein